MKIGQTPELPVPGTPAAPKKATQDQPATPAALAKEGVRAATTGASVSVSPLARTLEQADRGVGGDFDSVKVDAIRSAIKEGTYVVNPEAIADKLLSNASEMLNVARGY
jgi:negative regulator of flagellin synthesis FlgM